MEKPSSGAPRPFWTWDWRTSSPYERACLIAGLIKERKIKGKVIILDHPAVMSVQDRTKGFEEAISKHPDIEIVGVNDLTDNKVLAHLLKYDTILGRLDADVTATETSIKVGDQEIAAFSERNPAHGPLCPVNGWCEPNGTGSGGSNCTA